MAAHLAVEGGVRRQLRGCKWIHHLPACAQLTVSMLVFVPAGAVGAAGAALYGLVGLPGEGARSPRDMAAMVLSCEKASGWTGRWSDDDQWVCWSRGYWGAGIVDRIVGVNQERRCD